MNNEQQHMFATARISRTWFLSAFFLSASVTAVMAGDYTYSITGGAVSLTGYAGPGGVVTLPATINGMPVTSIGRSAFQSCASLTSVTIPEGVTSIGRNAFYACANRTRVSVPASVTSIERNAFQNCISLTGISFKGNAPVFGSNVFFGVDKAVFYCLPGTSGWNTPIDGRSAKVWNPHVKTDDGCFGMRGKRFGFNIAGTTNIAVVVETCTRLSDPVWIPVSTNTLVGGLSYFSDPHSTNSVTRFYRLRMP